MKRAKPASAIGALVSAFFLSVCPLTASQSDADPASIISRVASILDSEDKLAPEPSRSVTQELYDDGSVRETLEVIPATGQDEKPAFFLNGAPVDPEFDSLGRFDLFAGAMQQDEDEEPDEHDDEGRGNGLPVYNTLRWRRTDSPGPADRQIGQRQATAYPVEMETTKGALLTGYIWLDKQSGLPLLLDYSSDGSLLVKEARTSIKYRMLDDAPFVARQHIDVFFRVGALFLERSYRMQFYYE